MTSLSSLNGTPRLTRREADVVAHLVHGLKRKDIAAKLGLKEPTVAIHLGNIYRKFGFRDQVGLRSRDQAAFFFIRRAQQGEIA